MKSIGMRFALVLAATVLALLPRNAAATSVTLNAYDVKEFEYFGDDEETAYWYCHTSPVRLRNLTIFDGGVPIQWWIDRAGIEFDTSSIPDNANVTSVTLKVYVKQGFELNTVDVEFTRVPDPLDAGGGSACYGRWIQIGNNPVYTTDNILYGYNSISLGTDAADDLEDQLGDDFFTVGLKKKYEGLYDDYYWAELAEWNYTYPHQLVVTYVVPDPEYSRPASFGEETSSWGRLKDLYR
ncbi:MAG: hypothetical protein KC591_14595 [Gemmatimonadetes bacterium]|nr:hypothetical protein [Gemmatimonadota bacterium]